MKWAQQARKTSRQSHYNHRHRQMRSARCGNRMSELILAEVCENLSPTQEQQKQQKRPYRQKPKVLSQPTTDESFAAICGRLGLHPQWRKERRRLNVIRAGEIISISRKVSSSCGVRFPTYGFISKPLMQELQILQQRYPPRRKVWKSQIDRT